jgi:hypothetical protein
MYLKLLLGAALALACSLSSNDAVAAHSYDSCTNFVTSLPATITTQGNWCLNKDLSTGISSGAAITINANNVTLDCNDFKIGGLSAGVATAAVGIASSNRNNITVRNCNVRGFLKGIQVGEGNTSGHLIERNRIDNPTWVGMDIIGDGAVVRENRVLNVGGTTAVTNVWRAVGIYSQGDVEILGNLVSGVYATPGSNGHAVGIQAGNNAAGSIIDNNVKNILADGSGWSYGVDLFGVAGRVSVDSNNVIGPGTPNSLAVTCAEGNNVVLAGNLASGWKYAQNDCAHDGGNIIIP